MGTWRRSGCAAIAAALALGLGACSGDNDPAGEPPTTSPPEPAETKPISPQESSFPAEFRKQVDPICAGAQKEIDKLAGTEIRDRPTLQKLGGVYGDTASKLEKLEPPKQNATAYKQFTDAFRDGQDLVKRLDSEVGRGDSSAYQRVRSILDQVDTNVTDLAGQYGFTGCAGD